MKTKKLSELTIEELNKQKRFVTGIILSFGMIMLISLIVLVYLSIKNQKYGLIGVVPGLLLTMLPIVIRLNQIKSEIKSRIVL